MKFIKLLVLVFAVAALSPNAFSQSKLSGKVLEVLDGKTAVVQIGTTGKLTVVLQYVEIPEAEQPLNSVVKQHLTNLLLGKTVQLIPRGVVNSKTVAQVFISGVDVSQQLIRDGAAWFALPEKTEKSGAEVDVYISNEAQAKAEKRGVWSIEGIKPAWEFRAAKIKREKDEEVARIEAITKQNREKNQKPGEKKLPPPPAFFSNFEMWKDGRTSGMWDDIQFYAMDQQYNEKGLLSFRSEKTSVSFIMTEANDLKLMSGKTSPEINCIAAYATGKSPQGSQDLELFGMICKSYSDQQRFRPTSQLTFTTDGKKINYGKVAHLGRRVGKRYDEVMIYALDRTAFTKIAASDNVQIKMGDFSGKMPAKFHTMIKNLLLESANPTIAQPAKTVR